MKSLSLESGIFMETMAHIAMSDFAIHYAMDGVPGLRRG
jgi:hypothetical protein